MYTHKNNINLRKLDRSLLKTLLKLKNESWFGTHTIAIINEDDQNKWYDNISSSKNDLILIASINDVDIGFFKINGIDWINRICHIGHDIIKEHRGNGFGYKIVEAGIDFCFEILNMHRLDAEVLNNNLASQKTLFSGGFIKEGVRRKAVHKCSEYIDSIICGIIREDWLKLKRIIDYNYVCNISYTPMKGD